MRIRNLYGYETCIYSLKRKNAPWRVTSGCDNRAVLFTGRHYELPNSSICVTCPFYHASLFAVHDLPCVSDGGTLVFQDKGHGDDFACMWDVILSLLRSDWFMDCAASCVWQDEDGEEDVLSQAGKVCGKQ